MLFRRLRSRTVHHERQPEEEYIATGGGGGAGGGGGEWRSLTVWRKSLVYSCTGFTVIDSCGDLVYRVDNYIGQRRGEVILMDASGKSVLTVRRRKVLFLSLSLSLSPYVTWFLEMDIQIHKWVWKIIKRKMKKS